MPEDWVTVLVVRYDDDVPDYMQTLHIGPQHECEELLEQSHSCTADPLRVCTGAYVVAMPYRKDAVDAH